MCIVRHFIWFQSFSHIFFDTSPVCCAKSVRVNTNLGCKVVTHCWSLVSSKQYWVTWIIWDFERPDFVDNEIQVYCLEIKYALIGLNHDDPEFMFHFLQPKKKLSSLNDSEMLKCSQRTSQSTGWCIVF